MSDQYTITSVEELIAVIGEADPFVQGKVANSVDEYAASFIAEAPLIMLATSDGEGSLDVSPKGDGAGFVQVLNETTLLIPDRPGNKLAYGFRNILATGDIGIIFIMPGNRETLRINGKATISKDPQLLQQFSVGGKPALLCTIVNVQECFFHCGKAMIRSKLWQPESWPENSKSRLVAQAAKKLDADEALKNLIETEIEKNYKEELY